MSTIVNERVAQAWKEFRQVCKEEGITPLTCVFISYDMQIISVYPVHDTAALTMDVLMQAALTLAGPTGAQAGLTDDQVKDSMIDVIDTFKTGPTVQTRPEETKTATDFIDKDDPDNLPDNEMAEDVLKDY